VFAGRHPARGPHLRIRGRDHGPDAQQGPTRHRPLQQAGHKGAVLHLGSRVGGAGVGQAEFVRLFVVASELPLLKSRVFPHRLCSTESTIRREPVRLVPQASGRIRTLPQEEQVLAKRSLQIHFTS
jgi:hypothetical protein